MIYWIHEHIVLFSHWIKFLYYRIANLYDTMDYVFRYFANIDIIGAFQNNTIQEKTPPTLDLQMLDEERTLYVLTAYKPLKGGQSPLELEVIGK